MLRTLEDTMPRGRPFRYSQEEFLADVFGPDAVPKSKSPTRAPQKAWNAPPLSDQQERALGERGARRDAIAAETRLQMREEALRLADSLARRRAEARAVREAA